MPLKVKVKQEPWPYDNNSGDLVPPGNRESRVQLKDILETNNNTKNKVTLEGEGFRNSNKILNLEADGNGVRNSRILTIDSEGNLGMKNNGKQKIIALDEGKCIINVNKLALEESSNGSVRNVSLAGVKSARRSLQQARKRVAFNHKQRIIIIKKTDEDNEAEVEVEQTVTETGLAGEPALTSGQTQVLHTDSDGMDVVTDISFTKSSSEKTIVHRNKVRRTDKAK